MKFVDNVAKKREQTDSAHLMTRTWASTIPKNVEARNAEGVCGVNVQKSLWEKHIGIRPVLGIVTHAPNIGENCCTCQTQLNNLFFLKL